MLLPVPRGTPLHQCCWLCPEVPLHQCCWLCPEVPLHQCCWLCPEVPLHQCCWLCPEVPLHQCCCLCPEGHHCINAVACAQRDTTASMLLPVSRGTPLHQCCWLCPEGHHCINAVGCAQRDTTASMLLAVSRGTPLHVNGAICVQLDTIPLTVLAVLRLDAIALMLLCRKGHHCINTAVSKRTPFIDAAVSKRTPLHSCCCGEKDTIALTVLTVVVVSKVTPLAMSQVE